jgi:hypothetical protein
MIAQITIPDFTMPVTPTQFVAGVEDMVTPEIITFVGAMAAISLFKALMFGGR